MAVQPVLNSRFVVGGVDSLFFNGVTSRATCSVTPSTAAFSVGFWLNILDWGNADRIIDWQDGGPSNGFTITTLTNGAIQCVVRNSSDSEGVVILPFALNIRVWNHVAVTFSTNDLKLYVNGGLYATDSSVSMTAATTSFTLARRASSSSNFFTGGLGALVVDENTKWTPAQVSSLYAGVVPATATSRYDFAERGTDLIGSDNLTIVDSIYSSSALREPATSRSLSGTRLSAA